MVSLSPQSTHSWKHHLVILLLTTMQESSSAFVLHQLLVIPVKLAPSHQHILRTVSEGE